MDNEPARRGVIDYKSVSYVDSYKPFDYDCRIELPEAI